MELRIKLLHPQDASDSSLRAVHEFLAAIGSERNPEDPPRSAQYTIHSFRNFGLISGEKAIPFYVWHGSKVVGEAFIVVGLEDENSHMLWGDIQVLAEYRRQGIGTRLLGKVVEIAETEGRRLIIATSDSAIPAGEAFALKTGATAGLVEMPANLASVS